MWMHDRLKATDWNGRQAVNYVQVKRNGYRYTLFKEDTLRAYSKREDKTERLKDYPWFQQADKWLPKYSSLDGELYIEDHNATDVPTAIIEQWDNLQFDAFAVPYFDGVNWQDADVEWIDKFIADNMEHNSTLFGKYNGEDRKYFINLAVDMGYEGFVLKYSNYRGWYKVKPRPTIDCKVIGWKPGEGKFAGLVGSLVVAAYVDGVLEEVGRVGGFTDEVRDIISSQDNIGRIVEVEYQSIGSRGKLIHAAFNRFRDEEKTDADIYPYSRKG